MPGGPGPVESKLRGSIELILVNRFQMTSGHTGAKPQNSSADAHLTTLHRLDVNFAIACEIL